MSPARRQRDNLSASEKYPMQRNNSGSTKAIGLSHIAAKA